MMRMTAAAAALEPVLDALGSPRRREILRLVWDSERSAGDIHRAIPDVSFGAVSQHLGSLEDAGLVTRRGDGRFRYYSARRRELGHLGKWLDEMWASALDDLKRLSEAEEERAGARPRPGPRPRSRRTRS
jgi:DNA-binding transcriptional ArsR family regulator